MAWLFWEVQTGGALCAAPRNDAPARAARAHDSGYAAQEQSARARQLRRCGRGPRATASGGVALLRGRARCRGMHAWLARHGFLTHQASEGGRGGPDESRRPLLPPDPAPRLGDAGLSGESNGFQKLL
eukprot:361100-Chlamydomonas_euryale.AAC.6